MKFFREIIFNFSLLSVYYVLWMKILDSENNLGGIKFDSIFVSIRNINFVKEKMKIIGELLILCEVSFFLK